MLEVFIFIGIMHNHNYLFNFYLCQELSNFHILFLILKIR